MIILVIILLVAIIMLLMIYNMLINKKIDKYNNLNQKVVSLNVLQEFMNTIGEEKSADDKIRKINEILIEKYDIKYSTIVVYNGAEYVIKATNVDVKHWDTLKNLHSEEIFKEAIETATPKYITVEKEGERLPYQKMEFGRAKSAMFFPLYIDNVYIGYWIIESGIPHDFDKIDTTVLEVVKNNIISVIKTIESQSIVENIVREDLFTGLKSEEYLYSEGKRKIDQFTTSTICMFEIKNIVDINENLGRHTGNDVITKVSELVKQNISADYIFIRYMGPKFVIAFSGVEIEGVSEFMQTIKNGLENLVIKQNEQDYYEDEEPLEVSPKINVVLTNYYKGTAIEGTTKKLEEYLNLAPENESDINYI
ncbi:MAG: diguanylate cyclase [Clostridia bacterium]|nr:diguanylate cyclase [Clostridia bacterium]